MATTIAVGSLETLLEVPEKLTLTVLGEPGRLVSGRAVKLVGRRLIAQLAEHLEPETCFRIDCDDAMLLGETLGCWREGGVIFAALELQQALTRLEELAEMTHAPSRASRAFKLRHSA